MLTKLSLKIVYMMIHKKENLNVKKSNTKIQITTEWKIKQTSLNQTQLLATQASMVQVLDEVKGRKSYNRLALTLRV